MMYQEQQYVNGLANAVVDLFTQVDKDPSAREIAEAYFGDDKMLGKDIIGGVRKRLPKIRDELEKRGYSVCLVSKTYYDKFQHGSIQTMVDARSCLPLGNSRKAEGLYLPSGVDDPIWQAMTELNINSGAGKVKKRKDDLLKAVRNGRSSESAAGGILIDARERMKPDEPELERKVIEALEQGKEPEQEPEQKSGKEPEK